VTIEKGSEWGTIVPSRENGIEPLGDLARDLGVGDVAGHVGQWRRLPIDAIEVKVRCTHGEERVVSTTGWVRCGRRLSSDLVVVSSTAFVDGRRLFSRAHPNDGRFDWIAIHASMPLRQRWTFWRRTRTETHLPHPLVRSGSDTERSFTFSRPATLVSSDGQRIRRVVGLEARIVPDATATHIPSL